MRVAVVGGARGGYPEVRAARAALAVLTVVEAVAVAALAAVAVAVLGLSTLEALAAAALYGLVGVPVLAWAARRPGRLEAKISSFDSWCGGAERFEAGVYGVYYCGRGGVIACYDPVEDSVRAAAGRLGRVIEAPDRRDFRCTYKVRGRQYAEQGGVRVFEGTLYAPKPGDPRSMVEVEGVEVRVDVGCGDPAEAAEEAALRALRGVGAG